MNSSTTDRFRRAYAALPKEIQQRTQKAYRLWLENPSHPSLHFKKIGNIWSARVDDNYRVLGDLRGDTVYWFWIGSHSKYEELITRHRAS
ncbi:MAG TPA: hypothetical protein VK846_18750 [Candidatus Limnocylindria bacterium]|nr:hypothetical protein [Candidatus Limnocylindria bacterium]